MHITLEQIEEVHGLPPIHWVGSCHEVASSTLKLLPAGWRIARGMWVGPIEPGCAFSPVDEQAPRSMTQHSWCQHRDTGQVVDPTRFAFYAGKLPEVWCGLADENYDMFGAYTRRAFCPAEPPFKGPLVGSLVDIKYPESLELYLADELKHEPPYGRWELAWVAGGGLLYNPSDYLKELCSLMIKADLGVLIPIDIVRWFEL